MFASYSQKTINSSIWLQTWSYQVAKEKMIALRGKNGYIVEGNEILILLVIDGGSLQYPIATLLRVCNFSELDFHHFISSCHKSLLFSRKKNLAKEILLILNAYQVHFFFL